MPTSEEFAQYLARQKQSAQKIESPKIQDVSLSMPKLTPEFVQGYWQKKDMEAQQAEAERIAAAKLEAEQKANQYGNWFFRAPIRGVLQTGATVGGLTAMAGQALKSEPIKEAGMGLYRAASEKAAEIPGVQFGELSPTRPLQAGQWVLEKALENAPFMVGTLGTGLVGRQVLSKAAMKAAGGMIENQAKKNLIKQGVKTLTNEVIGLEAAGIAKNLGTKLGVIGGVGAMEAGGDYADLVERGLGSDKAVLSTIGEGLMKGYVETLGGDIRIIDKILGANTRGIFNRAASRVANAYRKGKIPTPDDFGLIKRIYTDAIRIGSQEAGEEVLQEGLALTNIAYNDPTFKKFSAENLSRLIESGAAGFAVGGLMGGVSGAVTNPEEFAARKGWKPPPPPPPSGGGGMTEVVPPTKPEPPIVSPKPETPVTPVTQPVKTDPVKEYGSGAEVIISEIQTKIKALKEIKSTWKPERFQSALDTFSTHYGLTEPIIGKAGKGALLRQLTSEAVRWEHWKKVPDKYGALTEAAAEATAKIQEAVKEPQEPPVEAVSPAEAIPTPITPETQNLGVSVTPETVPTEAPIMPEAKTEEIIPQTPQKGVPSEAEKVRETKAEEVKPGKPNKPVSIDVIRPFRGGLRYHVMKYPEGTLKLKPASRIVKGELPYSYEEYDAYKNDPSRLERVAAAREKAKKYSNYNVNEFTSYPALGVVFNHKILSFENAAPWPELARYLEKIKVFGKVQGRSIGFVSPVTKNTPVNRDKLMREYFGEEEAEKYTHDDFLEAVREQVALLGSNKGKSSAAIEAEEEILRKTGGYTKTEAVSMEQAERERLQEKYKDEWDKDSLVERIMNGEENEEDVDIWIRRTKEEEGTAAPMTPRPGDEYTTATTDLTDHSTGDTIPAWTPHYVVADKDKAGNIRKRYFTEDSYKKLVNVGEQEGLGVEVEKPTPDFETMVQDAHKWQSAAFNTSAEYGDDKKLQLAHSKITTKGDLDKYIINKYGVDSATARSVSNELTSRNMSRDTEAKPQDFPNEPWAKNYFDWKYPKNAEKEPGEETQQSMIDEMTGQTNLLETLPEKREPLGSISYVEAKKQPNGEYKLFYRGTRNEIFPGEKFSSASEARNYFKVQKAKEDNTKYSSRSSDWYYSQMNRVFEEKLPNRAESSGMKKIIQGWADKGEYKREELEWSGILDDPDSPLNKPGVAKKEDVLKWLDENRVEVKEVEKGEYPKNIQKLTQDRVYSIMQANPRMPYQQALDIAKDELEAEYQQERESTKFSQWQLPGAKKGSYRELLLTLPLKQKSKEDYEKQLSTSLYAEFNPENPDVVNEIYFKSSHFDEPNILAHVRFNERTDADGNRVLFVEEIQSDWGQTGRTKGYNIPLTNNEIAEKDRLRSLVTSNKATDEEYNRWQILTSREEKSGVPNMPFKKSWPLLAFKRVIRYAAENGYDSIAWTTGEQQAERYDLSKQISGIVYDENGNLTAYDLNGNGIINEQDVPPEKLPDYIGKEAAQKLLEQKESRKMLAGIDLKVGGEGMKGFYDQILPAEVNKYVKKWGGRVEDTVLTYKEPLTVGSMNVYQDVHGLKITPAMRDAAIMGQPLFKTGTVFMRDSGITFAQVKSMFPKSQVSRYADNSYAVSQNGRTFIINSVETISPDEAQFKVQYGRQFKTGEENIRGSYKSGVVTISKTGDQWTLAHESYHWLEDLGVITHVEKNAINLAAKKDAAIDHDMSMEEQRATWIENQRRLRAEEREKGLAGRAVQKIMDWIDALVNLFHQTARGVVRGIESGKVMGRRGVTAVGEEQYSTGHTQTALIETARENNDPDARPGNLAEAKKTETALEGSTAIGAAEWLSKNAQKKYRPISLMVKEVLTRLQSQGVDISFKIVHAGDSGPTMLNRARGTTEAIVNKKIPVITAWVNGSDVMGRVGVYESVVLHELIHAATLSTIEIGKRNPNANTDIAKNYRDLIAVANTVISHFNEQVRLANEGEATLTDFEEAIRTGKSNPFDNEHEVITWALTDVNMQQYLESISYQGKNVWTKFVELIRRLLKLPATANTALSEVLRVSEEILKQSNELELQGVSTAISGATQTIQGKYGLALRSETGPTQTARQTTAQRVYDEAVAKKTPIKARLYNLSHHSDESWFARYITPFSTRLEQISPQIKAAFRQFRFIMLQHINKDTEAVKPFMVATTKMNRDDQIVFDLARKNADPGMLQRLIVKYNISKEYAAFRKVMDAIYDRLIEVGYDVDYREHLHPRIIKDPSGFLAYLYNTDAWGEITEAIKEAQAKQPKLSLTDEQKAHIANIVIRGYGGKRINLSTPGNALERKVKLIDADLNQFYHDSNTALLIYITNMNKAIEARAFFGMRTPAVGSGAQYRKTMSKVMQRQRTEWQDEVKAMKVEFEKFKETLAGMTQEERDAAMAERIKTDRASMTAFGKKQEKDFEQAKKDTKKRFKITESEAKEQGIENAVNDSIGDYVTKLKLEPKQENELTRLFQDFFNYRASTGAIDIFKNFGYATAMGNFSSAITQIGDLAFAMYNAGIFETTKTIGQAIQGKSRITKKDLALEQIAEEFSNPTKLSMALNKLFKYTGFAGMDRIGKEVLVNSTIAKYEKMVQSNEAGLRKILEKMIPENLVEETIADFKTGEVTDNVKLVAFNAITNFQPTDVGEMPIGYIVNPGGRVFYMMKTYYIKQLDALKRESIDKIRSGNVKEGLGNFIRLAGYLMLMNAAADEIKDFMFRRDNKLSDNVIDNFLRLFGISRYATWRLRDQGVKGFLTAIFAPPLTIVEAPFKDAFSYLDLYKKNKEIKEGDRKGDPKDYNVWNMEIWKMLPFGGQNLYWWLGGGHEKTMNRRLSEPLRKSKEKILSPAEQKDFFEELKAAKEVGHITPQEARTKRGQFFRNQNALRVKKLKEQHRQGNLYQGGTK